VGRTSTSASDLQVRHFAREPKADEGRRLRARGPAPLLYFRLKCKVMSEATLSTKNQIVIPREAREALRVKPGDKLLVVVRGERVIVLERPKSPHSAIRGLARPAYPGSYLKKERRSWD
jgi:AbrB family looped-hinge helix DNA binding protein